MRLIDADALDEELEVIMVRYAALGRKSVAEDYNFVRTVLLTAPTIEVPRWIPVTERLPTWADGNKYGRILAVRRGHELSDFYHCNDVKENPDEFAHWMPIPTPPKDGK